MEQRTIIYREGNGKNEAKNQWEVGFQSPKIQLGMGKTKARISPNHKNVWDLGREWEMKKIITRKGNGKLVENLF